MIPLCEPPGALRLKHSRVVPNGVDTAYFQLRERNMELAAQLGIRDTDFVIGSNAGMGTHKRPDLMIRAVAELPNRENIKILLLGEKRASGNYVQLAGELGLGNNLICDGMFEDVRPYLSLFDLGFVLSDSIETSSYAAKEMMAMSIPLICARYSGLPENVDEGKTGYLVEPGDVSGLRKCVMAFLSLSKEQQAAFRAHSRDKVVREFSRERQIETMVEVYRDALA
jgi:glycosyltransferase involved in cell wall biosynthesis